MTLQHGKDEQVSRTKLTLDPVIDILLNFWQVTGQVEEEANGPQDHPTVDMLQTIIQNILYTPTNATTTHTLSSFLAHSYVTYQYVK